MKKRIVFAIIAVISGTMGMLAQTALVATLSHGNDVLTFYGTNAFIEAYNAAVEGDCITLSSGVFEGIDGIKERGDKIRQDYIDEL